MRGVFQRAVLDPGIWGTPRDLEAIARVMQEDLPPVMDYLERSLPVAGFLFDPLDRSRRRCGRRAFPQSGVRTSAHRCVALADHRFVR